MLIKDAKLKESYFYHKHMKLYVNMINANNECKIFIKYIILSVMQELTMKTKETNLSYSEPKSG